MPAAFRKALGPGGQATLVVTLLDQCLAVYPAVEWERLESQLAALPAFSKPVKALSRLLASRASDCEIESRGAFSSPRPCAPPPVSDARRWSSGC